MKKNVTKGISHGRVAENRRAKFDYSIIDTIEAGIILLGICSSEARLPIVEIEETSKKNVNDALKTAGLL